MEYCRQLGFEEKPDYDYLVSLFQDCLDNGYTCVPTEEMLKEKTFEIETFGEVDIDKENDSKIRN